MSKVALCVMLVNVSSVYAASTGIIHFNGMVTDNTCNVSVDGQGESGTISLPNVSVSDFKNVGDTSGKTNFNLVLTGCVIGSGNEKKVSAYFQHGATVDSTTGRLIQTEQNGAENVTLQLGSSITNKPIFVGDQNQANNDTFRDIVEQGEVILPYTIAYFAEGTVTAGNVTSSVVYNLQYQ